WWRRSVSSSTLHSNSHSRPNSVSKLSSPVSPMTCGPGAGQSSANHVFDGTRSVTLGRKTTLGTLRHPRAAFLPVMTSIDDDSDAVLALRRARVRQRRDADHHVRSSHDTRPRIDLGP